MLTDIIDRGNLYFNTVFAKTVRYLRRIDGFNDNEAVMTSNRNMNTGCAPKRDKLVQMVFISPSQNSDWLAELRFNIPGNYTSVMSGCSLQF